MRPAGSPDREDLQRRLTPVGDVSGLDLLVLFGSRARGGARPDSDWDFGYTGSAALDVEDLAAVLARLTGTDRVDVVDLSRAGGLLRYRAARDGFAVFEAREGLFERFWLDAVTFWCDAAPILGPAYESVLVRLGR